ncbi:MAG: hypothetical protein WBI20_10785 [Burkholderiaceae bacterium]
MKNYLILLAGCAVAVSALAKLPPPSDEAKAKAAETAAKTAHAGKVDGYLLCKAQDKSAAHYYRTAKATKKETQPAAATAACADPGKFVYTPAPAPAAVATTAAAPAPAKPAAAAPAAPAATPPAAAKKS